MNNKTFSKRVNEKLKMIFKQALDYEKQNVDDADDKIYNDFYNSLEDVIVEVNKTEIRLSYPSKKYDQVEFDVDFDYTSSDPRDIAKFWLFGLTQNHVIEVDGHFFKIGELNFVDGGDSLTVSAVEVIDMETTELPNGQKIYSSKEPEFNKPSE